MTYSELFFSVLIYVGFSGLIALVVIAYWDG